MRVIPILVAGLLLTGCKLLDQTTFAPSPEAPPAPVTATAADKVDTRTPLVTIDYATPNPQYQDVLRFAVRQAEARAPGVEYDVIGILPGGTDPGAAQQRVADIMRSVMAQGVPARRIHLGLRSAPAAAPQEVRVYVR